MQDERHRRLVAWVANEVMPHEAKVRAWLSRSCMSEADIDDVIQEAYCRLSGLDDVSKIDRADAYFFSIARNLLTSQMRRQQIVRIDLIAEMDSIAPFDEAPSPERHVAARIELERVRTILASLPERCRRIFEMRKIEGLPQREIAQRMGVPESTVENDGAKGVRLILAALKNQEAEMTQRLEAGSAGEGVA